MCVCVQQEQQPLWPPNRSEWWQQREKKVVVSLCVNLTPSTDVNVLLKTFITLETRNHPNERTDDEDGDDDAEDNQKR